MIQFTIPINPASKKNSQQIFRGKGGKPFITQSAKYKEFAKEVRQYVPKIDEPIDYPINLKCLFFRDSKRRVDMVNLQEAINDVLVECGFLADDNRDIIAASDGSRVFYDKEMPRIEVYVEPIKERYEQWKKEKKK